MKIGQNQFFCANKKTFPFSGRPQARVCEAAEASAQDGGECRQNHLWICFLCCPHYPHQDHLRQDHLGICFLCCPHYRCRQLENILKADKTLITPL